MADKKTAGLADVVAGQTSICTVGKTGHGLTYRGYDIEQLAQHAVFEEVAYLLLYGELPTKQQLSDYQWKLKSLRTLPDSMKHLLESIPGDSHPMDMMRTACSYLGNLEPESDFDQQQDIADRLLALFPSMIFYWYHFHQGGSHIKTDTDEDTLAGHFLHLLHGLPPDEFHVQAFNVSLILYAEHEFNASTFAARVAASTLSDFYSAIVCAIGTLRGPLHGGANEAAMALIERFDDVNDVETEIKQALQRKEKIMGFGHRVYKESDPRSKIIKAYAEQLSQQSGDQLIFPVSEKIEQIMWNEKKLFPNLDFYSASVFQFLGIPVQLFTPIFVCSRITGWAAHVFEQRANNALIRPAADYQGPDERPFISIEQRS